MAMKALSLTADGGEWLSASEIAQARLPSLPASRENAARFISRVAAVHPELVRPRSGRGGGLEVAAAALPAEARRELSRRAHADAEKSADLVDLAAEHEANKRQIATRGIGHLTARQRHVMEARAAVLLAIEARALIAGCGKDRAIQAFLADATGLRLDRAQLGAVELANDRGAGAVLSHRTVYRWFKAREDLGVIGLAPALTRQKADLPPWFDDFLRHYGKPSKPSIAEALREFNRTLPASADRPTEAAVRRCLKKMPQLERLKGREGKLALRARLAYTARDFADLLPTSVYVADGKTFDAEIGNPIHGRPFRPELTTIIDVATRRVVGWSASLDENTFGVVDALRRACGANGIPAIFYTDRGPGYRNQAMDAPLTGFMARAGITAMRALPYNSQAKGVVERLNQVYTAAAKALPTYIGRDMDKEAKLIAFKTTRREIAVAGSSRLLVGWDAFLDLIEETLASYNDRPHSSLPKIRDAQLGRLRHMTPNEMWAAKLDGFEAVIPDEAELDDMFRPYVQRRTRRALVDWLGNSYFAPALEPFDGQDVVVGYDIRDASRVWVREIDEVDGERVPGRLIAIATFEGHKTRYVPLSAEQAAMEKRAKGRLGRLQSKIEVVGQELRPVFTLQPAPPAIEIAPIGAVTPAVSVVPVANDQVSRPVVPAPAPAGKRPVFHDDVAFATWLAGNPDEATASDIALLRELLTTHSTNELLRMSGLDLAALRSIARSTQPTGAGTGQA
jgi:putative transposase